MSDPLCCDAERFVVIRVCVCVWGGGSSPRVHHHSVSVARLPSDAEPRVRRIARTNRRPGQTHHYTPLHLKGHLHRTAVSVPLRSRLHPAAFSPAFHGSRRQSSCRGPSPTVTKHRRPGPSFGSVSDSLPRWQRTPVRVNGY